MEKGKYIKIKNRTTKEIIPHLFYIKDWRVIGIQDRGNYKGDEIFLIEAIRINGENGDIIDEDDILIVESSRIVEVKEW